MACQSRAPRAAILAAGAAFLSPTLHAQQEDSITFDEIIVTVTPVGNATGLRKEQIAYNIQSASSDDIESMQSLHIGDFLNRSMGSVSINDAQNNPLQPDISYRGFTASPLLGLAQGLAVYQNGVRINEPLGDTVNWDLLPESAVHSLHLVGGANPLFGLNTLGGALVVDMKDGFNSEGHHLELKGGSFGRAVVSAETGGNIDNFAWYGNVQYFDEDGWRDVSPSDAANFYGSLGWRSDGSALNLNGQYGRSDLTGNGAIPLELLQIDRDAIFTAPDITENKLYMLSLDGSHRVRDDITFSGNVFYRRNETDSFNGDASEFLVCQLGGADALLEGLEGDDLEELDLEQEDICGGQFASAADLETFLNDAAVGAGEDPEFNIEDLTSELSGTGELSGSAINNSSTRIQRSYGSDVQLAFDRDLFDRDNQLVVGAAWFNGESSFNSILELANLDPVTRSTAGLGTGTFVDEAATNIKTDTSTWSLYLTDTIAMTDRLSVTLSGRFNRTSIELADQSGERPELNGKHHFNRFNPALGMTYQLNEDVNLYGSYSESSRAPTPVELACNEHIFEIAVANAIAEGEDPEDVEFECRLPNAFLADPPLEQVVARSFEVGARWNVNDVDVNLGLFHTTNNDDIIFQTTGRATGLFANVDKTRRLGFESRLNGNWRNLDWFLAYSYIEATFEAPFDALSPNHPFADEDEGTIAVAPGDRIPGVPDHHLKLGGDYLFGDSMRVGIDLLYNSGQRVRGDESGQLEKTDAYAVLNLRGQYRLNDHLVFFASVNNLLDEEYESFGLIGEEPGEVDVPAFAEFDNPRFLGPGAPRSAFVGVKLSL
ncbi:MAG TPA: TonB-dependent receptor [Woeseiaceae bacterium]|nr:TonB-dependent receptor [Woeseiaceae bacterium]